MGLGAAAPRGRWARGRAFGLWSPAPSPANPFLRIASTRCDAPPPCAPHASAHTPSDPDALRRAEAAAGGDDDDADDGSGKQNRNEKKARKAMLKLGMKPVAGVNRVTVKKSKNILFVIQKPDVYKGGNDTYVIFGEAKIEDLSTAASSAAADQFRAPAASAAFSWASRSAMSLLA